VAKVGRRGWFSDAWIHAGDNLLRSIIAKLPCLRRGLLSLNFNIGERRSSVSALAANRCRALPAIELISGLMYRGSKSSGNADLRISLISACSPPGIEMMRPSSMPRVPTAPVIPIRRLNLSCHLLGSNRIRFQQRSGFSTLGRNGQRNKHANNQDAEYCLDSSKIIEAQKCYESWSTLPLPLPDLLLEPSSVNVQQDHIQ
jgi:hypothetical protein